MLHHGPHRKMQRAKQVLNEWAQWEQTPTLALARLKWIIYANRCVQIKIKTMCEWPNWNAQGLVLPRIKRDVGETVQWVNDGGKHLTCHLVGSRPVAGTRAVDWACKGLKWEGIAQPKLPWLQIKFLSSRTSLLWKPHSVEHVFFKDFGF